MGIELAKKIVVLGVIEREELGDGAVLNAHVTAQGLMNVLRI